jgi:hypothetical protein
LIYVLNSKVMTTSVLEGDERTFQHQKKDPNKITVIAIIWLYQKVGRE